MDAASHFAAGAELAERNASGEDGATKEGLLRARAELLEALRLGHPVPISIHRMLAKVNGALAQDWSPMIEERTVHEDAQRAALREVVALAPGDAGARLAYALALPDPAPRIRELREAARLAPRDGEIRRVLGETLMEAGDEDEGARQLVEAARLLSREALEEHGVPMLRLLHAHSREEEEARVRERIEQLGL
jgi:hypothetical protein